MEIDTSELDRLAAELGQAPAKVAKGIAPVVRKGSLNIKNQLTEEMRGSRSFKGAADMSFETKASGDGFEAEIGPRSDPGRAGNLANIAYFGGATGGGTVPDPRGALDDEAPRFVKALEDIVRDAL